MKLAPMDRPFPLGSAPPRTQGCHVYDIIKSIMIDLGEKQYKESPQGRIIMETGFLWERALESAWGEHLGRRPGEVIVDGVIGSPDGIKIATDKNIVEEYKCTWKSANRMPDENLNWLIQTKAYCFMLECTTCHLHVLHLNGDYKPPRPMYKLWELEYSPQELIDNWSMMINHARSKGLLT